jgi:serine/threonine-protein kinase
MFQARLGMHQQRDSLKLAYADSAITLLQRRVAQYRDNAEQHARLAYTLGMRGRHDEALAAAQRAAELVPLSRDAVDGSGYVRTLAEVYTMMDDHDRAIELLDQLLSIPSLLSYHDLRLNPFWDPLREDPRFQALIDRGHVVF